MKLAGNLLRFSAKGKLSKVMSQDFRNNPNHLRDSYLSFMREQGSVIVPSAGLLPENDPTTLFTGSGMQPMIPYLLGEKHPAGSELANVQKCLRTVDIDAVGDNCHLTFFEMTGRWIFGANPITYKEIQVRNIWRWQIQELGIDPQRFYVTVYCGNEGINIARDDEAIALWSELYESVGIDPVIESDPWTYGSTRGGRIFVYGETENWWSRAGVPANMPLGEPGGPDSEMFYDFAPEGDPQDHPAAGTPRFLEIGNNVFMSYRRTAAGFQSLDRPNIDYGGGLERIASAVNGDPDIYLTPFFKGPKHKLEELTGQSYESAKKEFRVILDHSRAAAFLIADGASPSNVDAGYITRRLMRRAIRMGRKLGLTEPFFPQLCEIYIAAAAAYPELSQRQSHILEIVAAEEAQFRKTLLGGEREIKRHLEHKQVVSGAEAFYFYETFGFPRELTEEFLVEHGATMLDPEGFARAAREHTEKSRSAAEGKFKGGLADHSEVTTALHTAAHLMLAGLRKVLGHHVHQRGSNITAARVRFDFSHNEKMTEEQKRAVAEFVNNAVAAQAEMRVYDLPKQQAKDEGVEGSFWEKYPDVVKVYEFSDANGQVWSRELCGGPHAANTGLLKQYGVFKIQKEESSALGVRRIKAVLS